MFLKDLMVLSKTSDFFSTKVEGWPKEATRSLGSRMDSTTFPFIFPACDGIFSFLAISIPYISKGYPISF